MKMNYDFATRLMNDLFLLACYANGRLPETDEEISTTERYARETFMTLANHWEETMGEEWEIEEPNSEEEELEECDNPNCPDCVDTLDDECPCGDVDCEECHNPECPLNFQYVKTDEPEDEDGRCICEIYECENCPDREMCQEEDSNLAKFVKLLAELAKKE